METATQTKNFLSFISRLAAEGWGEEPRKEMQGNFWVCPRESASAVEALPSQPGRTLRVQATTRSARAKWVRAKSNISPQIETSRSDRAAPLCGAAEWAGRKCRREAANSVGAGAEK